MAELELNRQHKTRAVEPGSSRGFVPSLNRGIYTMITIEQIQIPENRLTQSPTLAWDDAQWERVTVAMEQKIEEARVKRCEQQRGRTQEIIDRLPAPPAARQRSA